MCALQQIREFLDKERTCEEHKTADMFVMFVLSHGVDGHVYTLNAEKISIEEIVNYFTAGKCAALISKPKLFFVQACQGGQFETMFDTAFSLYISLLIVHISQ